MIIKGDQKYIEELSKLWKTVFSDTDEAINIFFEKQYGRCETFCCEKDGIVVSAFYLLPCLIKYNGCSYNGRYLYAAATYPEYRGKKLMSGLIDEAQTYCENNGIEFIALLPAEESLYGYYGRFGFREAMYRYETEISLNDKSRKSTVIFREFNSADELKKCRDLYTEDRLIFDTPELDYIIKTMKSYGSRFLATDNCYAVVNNEDNEVYEFIGNDIKDAEEFIDVISGEASVYSPYDLSIFGTAQKKKYGMIYAVDIELEGCCDIYMNLALD